MPLVRDPVTQDCLCEIIITGEYKQYKIMMTLGTLSAVIRAFSLINSASDFYMMRSTAPPAGHNILN